MESSIQHLQQITSQCEVLWLLDESSYSSIVFGHQCKAPSLTIDHLFTFLSHPIINGDPAYDWAVPGIVPNCELL